MSKGVKLVALLVAILLTGGLVTGIAIWSTGLTPDETVQTAGLFDNNGVQIEEPGTMLTIDGNKISFEEYRYFYLTNKYYTSQGDPAFWETDFDGKKAADLKQQTEDAIRQQIAIFQIGKENGIALTEEERQEIADTVASDKESFGAEFEQRLSDTFVANEAQYIQIMENQTLMQKIQTEMTATPDEEVKKEIYEQAISAQHILIAPFSKEETPASTAEGASQVTPSEEETKQNMENARVLADEVYQQIIASADPITTFAEMRTEHDADNQGQPAEGYTFTEGDMVTAFYEAARALKENEISKPVETEYGFHIILRMPLDKTYVDENLLEQKVSTIFQEKVKTLSESFKVEPGEHLALVSPQNLR